MRMSGASEAPTVSAFMAIALSGSTTEPVISHRTRKVSTASRMIASGRCEPIAFCWSTKVAASPVTLAVKGTTRRPTPTLHGPDLVDDALGGVTRGIAGHRGVDLPRVVAQQPRRAHALDPVEAGDAVRVGGDGGAIGAGGADRHGHRGPPGAGEVAVERVGHRAGALALRDHPAVVGRGPLDAQRRQRGGEHERRGHGRHQPGPAHHGVGEARTSGRCRGARSRRAGQLAPPHRQERR